MQPFWLEKRLEELSPDQWEALCDGCGRCCLHKLQDEETDEVVYTRVACRLLDLDTCRCRQYAQRQALVPDCLVLAPDRPEVLQWMPRRCAYRLLAEGIPLPAWHPLVTGRADSTQAAGVSVCGFALSEDELADPDDMQDFIIPWP
ncbi:MAG: YcgN family cysteine cluster protein [Thiohalomonadaceae bacterium]